MPFSVSGTVTSGGPIVAELWLDGADPAKGHGSSAAPAIPVSSTSWVMPIGLATPALDLLGVSSAGSNATLTVTILDKGRATRARGAKVPRRVLAGGRVTFDLVELLADHPGATVLVKSSSPVVVSRLQAGADAHGLVSTAGLPAGPLALP